MTSIVINSLKPVTSFFSVGAKKPERISITVRLWDATGKITVKDTPFTISPDSPLKDVLRIFATREALFPKCFGHLRFMVGSRVVVSEDETANDLCLGDGECIDAIPCEDDIIGSRFV